MEKTPSLRQAAVTQLRVLQRKGRRAAIRLEKIFWSQLDELAKEEGLSTSQFAFQFFDQNKGGGNRTALLRCLCLDRSRRKLSSAKFQAESFDMLALIAACPTPVAVITPERRLAAFNPGFGELLSKMRGTSGEGRSVQLSFNEPLPSIQRRLIDEPKRIGLYQIGLQVADGKARYFLARFALADRTKGLASLLVAFLELPRPSVSG